MFLVWERKIHIWLRAQFTTVEKQEWVLKKEDTLQSLKFSIKFTVPSKQAQHSVQHDNYFYANVLLISCKFRKECKIHGEKSVKLKNCLSV